MISGAERLSEPSLIARDTDTGRGARRYDRDAGFKAWTSQANVPLQWLTCFRGPFGRFASQTTPANIRMRIVAIA